MMTRGLLGLKLGMTQVFADDARVVPVTVVKAGPCTVTQVKTSETDGYAAVQLAFGSTKKLNKPESGHLAKSGAASAQILAEVRAQDPDGMPQVGDILTVSVFRPGEFVDVTGTSKGKGYAGVMKRHNFHGMGDGHGVKKTNRHPGAVGACATPARTFKGTRMAGRMGGDRVTIQTLEVVDIDTERDLILIRGAVPGNDGGVVLIRPSVKKPSDYIPPPEPAEQAPAAAEDEAPATDETSVDQPVEDAAPESETEGDE